MIEQAKIYQNIADELSSQFPEGWEKCEVNVEIDESLATFQLHCLVSSNKTFLDLTEELDNYFRELWNTSKVKNRGPWKKCKYTLMADGNFTADFDYDGKLSWED